MPCPTHNPCPTDVAVENLSAEDPDIDQFLGFYSKFTNPRLGMDFGDTGLPGWCASAASPLAAIICARNGSLTNNQNGSITAADIEGMPPPVALPPVEGSPTAVVRRVAGKRFVVPGRAPVGQFFRVLGDQSDIGPWLNKDQHCFAYCPTGKEFEGVQEAGTILSYFSQAEADAQAKAIACSKAEQQRVCFIPISKGPYCLNSKVEIPILCANASGKIVQLVYDGNIPSLVFKQKLGTNIGILSGTCTKSGIFGFGVSAVIDGVGVAAQGYELDVMGIKNPGPTFVVGVASTFQYNINGGGNGPFVFSSPDPMPPGLTLHSDGSITGTPTTDGDFSAEIRFVDPSGRSCTIQDFYTVFPCQGTMLFSGPMFGSPTLMLNAQSDPTCQNQLPFTPSTGPARYAACAHTAWPSCTMVPTPGQDYCPDLESRFNLNFGLQIINACPFNQNLKVTISPRSNGGLQINGVAFGGGIISMGPGATPIEFIAGFHTFFPDLGVGYIEVTFEWV